MNQLKKLLFGPGLMEPTITGGKRVTLRKYRPEAHNFEQYQIVYGAFEDGLNILIEITRKPVPKPFSRMTDEEAQGSGYKNAEEAFEGLKKFYTNLQKDDLMVAVHYKI